MELPFQNLNNVLYCVLYIIQYFSFLENCNIISSTYC